MLKRDWTNITLKDWYNIQDILSVQDDYTTFNLLDYLYNINSSDMSLSEVSKYSNSLSFLNDAADFENFVCEDEYTINGTTYVGFVDITNISVAQFIDYQNYIKEKPFSFEKVMSIFIVPKGHTYNDGYDMKKVQNDLLELPFRVCQKVAFFLVKQLQTFVQITLYYLTAELEKMEMTKEEKDMITGNLQKMTSQLSELFHIA